MLKNLDECIRSLIYLYVRIGDISMHAKGFFMLVITTLGTSLLAFAVVVSSIASGSTQKTVGDDMEQTYTFIKKGGERELQMASSCVLMT